MAPGSRLFSGLRFTASEICLADKIKLAALITYHGGDFSRYLDRKCTHLVTRRPKGEKDKNRNIMKNLTCVTPGWVLTSAKKRVLANPKDYDPGNF